MDRGVIRQHLGSGRLAPVERRELTSAILERTTGPVCVRAREALVGGVEEPTDAASDALVALHLDHCADCRAFAAAWQDAAVALPTLAEIDPGPQFSSEVFARTTRRRVSAWAAWWARVIARPHFSLEAAYVAACLVVLLAGNPVALAGAMADKVQSLTADPGVAVSQSHGAPTAGAAAGVARSDFNVNRVPPDSWWEKAAARVTGWWSSLHGWVSDVFARITAFLGITSAPAGAGNAEVETGQARDVAASAEARGLRNLAGQGCV